MPDTVLPFIVSDDPTGPSVRLLRAEGDEDDLLAAALFESTTAPEEAVREALAALDTEERAQLLGELVGRRANRRHRPGRGFEALRYRFEIVADYGAFRDLQRHRLLGRRLSRRRIRLRGRHLRRCERGA